MTIRSPAACLGLAGGLILAVAGCSANSISATPSARATSAPSPTASPTPVPAQFTEQANGSITWVDGAGHERTVPEFNGLQAQLQDGKVIYADAKGEAAEFKPNLMVSGEQTGVLVVRGDIVASMTKTAHDAGKYQFALMIDPRSIPNAAPITTDFDKLIIRGVTYPRVAIEIPSERSTPLVQFNYDKPYAILLVHDIDVIHWQLFNQNNESLPKTQIPKGYELDLTYVYGTNSGQITTPVAVWERPDSPVGDDFGLVSGEMSVICVSFDATRTLTLSKANLLTSDGTLAGTPIAIMANPS